jgi:hypothetical protein
MQYRIKRSYPDGSTHTYYVAGKQLDKALMQAYDLWPECTWHIRPATREEIEAIFRGI